MAETDPRTVERIYPDGFTPTPGLDMPPIAVMVARMDPAERAEWDEFSKALEAGDDAAMERILDRRDARRRATSPT